MTTETSTTTDTAANERSIQAAADQIVAEAARKAGLAIAEVPAFAKADALQFARQAFEAEAAKQSNPYYHLYEQEKQARESAEAVVKAVRESQTTTTADTHYTHPVSAERARKLVGDGQWYMFTNAQKLAAIQVDNVDQVQVRNLFGKGADGKAAVDFQRANPRRYAALREAAKVLNLYGA